MKRVSARQRWNYLAAVFLGALSIGVFGCLAYEAAIRGGRTIGVYLLPSMIGPPLDPTTERNVGYYDRFVGLSFSGYFIWTDWGVLKTAAGPNGFTDYVMSMRAQVDFVAHRGKVWSGPLVWGHNGTSGPGPDRIHIPEYLEGLSGDALRTEMRSYINTIVGQFPEVDVWTVAEPFSPPDADGNVSLRNNVFKRELGSGWVAEALRYIYEANPNVTVLIDEVNADGMNAKADMMFDYYRDRLVRDAAHPNGAVPVQNLAVGLQMHIDMACHAGANPSAENVQRNMERFANLGVTVHITGMDVQVRCLTGTVQQKLERQRNKYQNIVAACMAVPKCTTIIMQDVGDCDSWLRRILGHENEVPNLFDCNYAAKPAYFGVLAGVKGEASPDPDE